MPLIESEIKQRDGLLAPPPLSPPLSSPPPLPIPYLKESTPSSSPSHGNKISPAVLFVIVIIAVIFFISGLVHLLIRFLLKQRSPSSISQSNRYSAMSASDAFQRQLQQLFQLHDSGLDQAFIDALPVFLYKEIMGLREPFDCAVCLCEFSEDDKLRLLPSCGHAFHIDCIDTWLLSNSTCPLCRGSLFTQGFSMENPIFDFEGSREEDRFPGHGPCGNGVSSVQKQGEDEIVADKRVFFVRLGKFRSTNDNSVEGGGVKEGETSSSSNSNLDARRCYSMGSFQYVVADSSLQVALCPHEGARGNGEISRRRMGQNGNSAVDGDIEGKRINMRSKGESFSVSKIWQWSKKGKYPSSSGTNNFNSPANVGLPWIDRTQAV